MSTKELIDSAVEHLQTSASVKRVYGDPVVVDGKTIIPVAKVALGFGGGSGHKGEEASPETAATAGQTGGEGAGGGVTAKPVGVVEISGEETKFIPFGQTKKLAMTALVGSAIGLALGWLFSRRVGKN
jgi:uncharacterized spore protein YtfJ